MHSRVIQGHIETAAYLLQGRQHAGTRSSTSDRTATSSSADFSDPFSSRRRPSRYFEQPFHQVRRARSPSLPDGTSQCSRART
jgi:hypothetical protein